MTTPAAETTNLVTISNVTTVAESREPGVLISTRQYKRYLERLEGCKPSVWADLWLALAGAGGGLAITALVTRLTLPSTATAAQKVLLLMLTILGAVCLILCMVGYVTQRRQCGKDIHELKTDLQMYADS